MLESSSELSLLTNLKQKHQLAAVLGGLSLTINIWFATLSFMPMSWLDWLEQRPAWPYYIVSAMVWAILSRAIYLIFRHSWNKPAQSTR
jgi:hypothetical protein